MKLPTITSEEPRNVIEVWYEDGTPTIKQANVVWVKATYEEQTYVWVRLNRDTLDEFIVELLYAQKMIKDKDRRLADETATITQR